MSLADALERAASELAPHADAIRDANGDPDRLLETLAPAPASELLGWLLAHEPAAGEELALAWTDRDAGAAPIAALEGAELPKAGRKVVRKALHRLRSRGVEVEARAPAPVVARPRAVEDAFEAALVSPLDRRGARMAYLVEPHPAGGARMYEAVLDDARGIVDFRVYSAGRSRVRAFLRSARASQAEESAGALLDVATSELRALVARAAKRQSADHPAPRAFIEHRSQLALAGHARTPGDRARDELGAASAAGAAALEAVAERVRTGAIGPWPPDLAALRKLGERVREGFAPGAVLSGEGQSEATRALLAEAAREVFGAGSDGFAAVSASRLRETAFVLWRRGRDDDARAALAAAAAFEDGLAENPVALAFVEVWVAPLLAGPGAAAEGPAPEAGEGAVAAEGAGD